MTHGSKRARRRIRSSLGQFDEEIVPGSHRATGIVDHSELVIGALRKMSTETEVAEKDRKTVTILVNGREKSVPKDELTFNKLISLAFDNPPTGPQICFTITYRRGHGKKPEGNLAEGESVNAKEGMIINVSYTDKS